MDTDPSTNTPYHTPTYTHPNTHTQYTASLIPLSTNSNAIIARGTLSPLQKKRIKEEAIAEVQSCMKIEVEKVIAKQVASKQKQAVAPLPQAQVVSSIFL